MPRPDPPEPRHKAGAAAKGPKRPPLRLQSTTLWEYPSQHYDSPSGARMQGDKEYVGATPSWIIWQLLTRYTREGDLVVDPMCGSGTTIDVARDLGRRALGYDLAPTRPDIFRADARSLPLEPAKADFVFIDPPYSTHVDYSDDPRCIGKLDAADELDHGAAYFNAMRAVIADIHRVLRDRRYMALYVSDSWRKRAGKDPAPRRAATTREARDRLLAPGITAGGVFMPIGFALFAIMRELFTPIDIICVVRHNQKLDRGNWRRAAEEGNFYLRGFNYLFIMKKQDDIERPALPTQAADVAPARPQTRTQPPGGRRAGVTPSPKST